MARKITISNERLNGLRRSTVTLAAGILLIAGTLLVSGCGGDSEGLPSSNVHVDGQQQTAFGGTVRTWATVDSRNTVLQAGVTIPLSTIQAAAPGVANPVVSLPFPDQVGNTTFVRHFMLDWNEQGHPPDVYAAPHFDLHFYNIPAAAIQSIDCADGTQPAAIRVPSGYGLPPVEANGCVPMMGYHASPGTDFAPGNAWTHSMILGYYGGRQIFVEPMITRDFLLRRQDFTLDIPRPTEIGEATRYPTLMTADYDVAADAYHIILSNFVAVN